MADLKTRMLSWKAPSEIIRSYFHKQETLVEKFCTTCGHVGMPSEVMKGRREIELTLWTLLGGVTICYLVTAGLVELLGYIRGLTGLHKLFSLTGKMFLALSVVYTVFRISTQHQICGKCQGVTVIPVDSPRAQEMLKGR